MERYVKIEIRMLSKRGKGCMSMLYYGLLFISCFMFNLTNYAEWEIRVNVLFKVYKVEVVE